MRVRSEYPRPQFQRKEWQSLNGVWEFCYDDDNKGIKEQYYLGNKPFDLNINVPFSYQYPDSGIGDETIHDILWYKKKFFINKMSNKNLMLCFNGVDYLADVYLNGHHLMSHEGGYAPFEVDITGYINNGENTLVLRVYDPQKSDNPRGKQTWKGKNFECFYLPNSGVWQSVWIESFNKDYIKVRSLFTDIDKCEIKGEVENAYFLADKVEVSVCDSNGKLVTSNVFEFSKYGKTKYNLPIENMILWDVENPYLYNITYKLFKDNELLDEATSRFGMRKFDIQDGIIKLNNKPFYQRLILDQGYWKSSGITVPDISCLKDDILLAKEMGFNGARKHQKIEDPYWYYYAEELGFVTWCEMPSAYEFCTSEASNFIKQWTDVLIANRNFTSIVTYVPLNESWGVAQIYKDVCQQNLGMTMYYICKTLSPNTIVSINDGWENPECSDILTAHDYCKEGKTIVEYFDDFTKDYIPSPRRHVLWMNHQYKGQPVLFSEFGGIMLSKDSHGDNWGYGDNALDNEEIYQRIESLMDGIKQCKFQGFCYTQLTDVQQEVNGLLDEEHHNKFDNKRLYKIFTK